MTLKVRDIGNSEGIILPHEFGLKRGTHMYVVGSYNKSGDEIPCLTLTTLTPDQLAKARGKQINDCFKHLDQALDEKQVWDKIEKDNFK